MSLSLGPLILPISRLLLLTTLILFYGFSRLFTSKNPHQKTALNTVFNAFLIGLFVARMVFVIRFWSAYQANLFQIIDIRDGGFDPSSGWIAALLTLIITARRTDYRLLKSYLYAGLASAVLMLPAHYIARLYADDIAIPKQTVYQLSGHPTNLTQFAGKPLVLNYWATWCPPCRKEMPALEHAQQRYNDIQIVLVNQGETAQQVRQFLSEQQLNLAHVLLDPSAQTSAASGTAGLPTTLFFDADGTLMDSHVGLLSQASLASYLQRLSAQPAP